MANIKRANASSITKSGVAIADVPDAPTIGAVTDLGSGSTASVAYTAAVTGGAATTFTATSSPGGFTGTGSSPITVSGLESGTAYTFTVTASNSSGSAVSSASSSLTLIAVGAYESIASSSPTSGTSITFSSIPGTYKTLQLRMITRDTFTNFGADYSLSLQFNGSSANAYTSHAVYGNGSAATGVGVAATSSMNLYASGLWSGGTVPASTFAATVLDIHDYASTSKNKTVRYIAGADYNSSTGVNYGVTLGSGAWLSTSAITSLTIAGAASAFASGTTFALYGIKG